MMTTIDLSESITLAALRHADHCAREFLRERCISAGRRNGVEYHDLSGFFCSDTHSDETLHVHQQVYRYAIGRRIVTPHPHNARLARIEPPSGREHTT